MQTTYDGAHSLLFGSKHTWEDWGLVPASLPTVALPEVNTNTIEIPGANGVVDLTDTLLGFPTYKTRTGSWTFKIAHDVTGLSWAETYSMIAAYLHGRRRQCILLDDRSYYYTGRFSIDELKTEKMCNSITIKYELNPFKEMIWTTCEDWQWDPFDLIYGEINKSDFKDIPIIADSQNFRRWTQNQIGAAPVTPIFTVESTNGEGMTLQIDNSAKNTGVQTFELTDGENYNPLIELACPDPDDYTNIVILGEGTISIDFRPGRL